MCCKNVLHFGRNRFEFHFAKALVDGCCVSKGIGGLCIESDQHPTASYLQEDAPGPSGDVPFL